MEQSSPVRKLVRILRRKLLKKRNMAYLSKAATIVNSDSCTDSSTSDGMHTPSVSDCFHSTAPSTYLRTCKASTLPHSGTFQLTNQQSTCFTAACSGIYSACDANPTSVNGESNSSALFCRQNTSTLSEDSGLCVEGALCSAEDEFDSDNDVFTDSCELGYDDEGVYVIDDDGWWIEAKQLCLGKLLNSSPDETVYSGYWHGSVVIHSRRSSDSELREGVIADLNMLTSIRHENIQLFLGVCDNLHMDHLSLVMDQMKGQSLHTILHKQSKQFDYQAISRISRQLAQGIDYLHAKGIYHPLLTSKSVNLHYRVCISMLSHYGAPSGNLESNELVYLSPETIRTATITRDAQRRNINSVPLEVDSSTLNTPQANVFSFGTLMFELLAMEKPYSGAPANYLIFQVGSNDRVLPLDAIPNGKYKQMIKECWRSCPEKRPTFTELLWTLENKALPRACGLKSTSRFSLSEPKRLDKLGL